jgi:hypothetical protein
MENGGDSRTKPPKAANESETIDWIIRRVDCTLARSPLRRQHQQQRPPGKSPPAFIIWSMMLRRATISDV